MPCTIMLKTVLIFLFGLMIFQTVCAQKSDSTLLYVKYSGELLEKKDNADYFLLVMFPANSSSGIKINNVKEFYKDNKLKLTGKAIIYVNGTIISLNFVGQTKEYSSNGKLTVLTNYKNSFPDNENLFYPNGQLYANEKYIVVGNKYLLMECHDTTGKVLAHNGNGIWLKYDKDFKQVIEQGPVLDGLKDGVWHEMANDSVKYSTIYKKGDFVSSTDPNRANGDGPFMAVEVEPHYKYGGAAGFNAFLAKTIKFPATDRTNGTQGKVIVTFVVEKDGSLSDIKVLRSPSQTMADAAIEAVHQSPKWVPGIQNGRPVRVQYTISFAFSLGGK